MNITSSINDRGAFWHRSNTSRRGALFAVLLLAILATVWTAIGDRVDAASGPSADLEQCANDGSTCDASHPSQWQTGNLNGSNSHYSEGESVPYRSVIEGLTVGATYAVTISWKSSDNGRHTLDYITSYDRTESSADPCAGSACTGSPATIGIPTNSSLGIPQAGGSLSLWGGTFTSSGATVANTGDLCGDATCTIAANPSGYSLSGTLDTTSTTSMRVYFTATTTSAVLAWGGHIASQIDWGIGLSAGAVNGSSYHMYFSALECSNLDCNVGQKDRSMSTTAVTVPASITIEKSASVQGSTSFGFTASPAPLTTFDLVDDGSIDDPDATPASRTFGDIVDFTTYTITESSTSLWSLTNVACSVLAPNGGSQTVDGSSVTIDLREGELVTCVYSNARDPQPAIDLVKSADPVTYAQAGDVIEYTYTISNVGDSPIGPTQFTITDDHIDDGTAFDCGAADKTLIVAASFSCTHDYTVTADDVTGGSVKNTATAHAGRISSSPAVATVTFVAPTTTTTTTTTVPETTTTVTATTVVEQEVTTTTTTTIPVTTTIVDTCITIPRETPETTVAPTSTINPTTVPGTINPGTINQGAIDSTTTTVFDPCVVPTTIPGTIVPTGASTTSPTIQPTGTTAKLPTTGGNTEPSGRTIALIILIGASLIIMSRRQVRRAVADRDPS